MKYFILVALVIGLFQVAQSQPLCSTYTSAKSLFRLTGFSSVKPRPYNCPLGCSLYIGRTYIPFTLIRNPGWAGQTGVLGPVSPLAVQSYSTQLVARDMESPEFVDGMLKKVQDGGPLSSVDSPLGAQGPLGDSFWTVMPKINDFTMHMQGQGLWSILGPIGPLGALGSLGPLGVMGAHGFRVSKTGDYVDPKTNKVQTHVTSVWDEATSKTWPLFEYYTSERAKSFDYLDTSFMVADFAPQQYKIKNPEKQYVSIVAVPLVVGATFDLKIRDAEGKVIAKSDSLQFINWVQLADVAPGTEFSIEVTQGMMLPVSKFVLHVVGSTTEMLRKPHIPYQGDYIKPCDGSDDDFLFGN